MPVCYGRVVLEIKPPPPLCSVLGSGKGPSGPRGLIISFNVTWRGRDCGHAGIGKCLWSLSGAVGIQRTSNNDTFVRSRRGTGLRKHSQGNSGTPFVVVLAHKTTNCQEKFTKQNTGTREGCGLFKKWFSTWSEGFFFFFLLTADVSNSVGLLKQNSQERFVLHRLPLLDHWEWMDKRMNEWMDSQISEYW